MSASREKRERKSSDAITKNTRDMRNNDEHKKDRRFYIMCIVIAVALVVVTVFSLLYSNDSWRKNMTAVTIDGEHYSAAQMDFYYYSSYYNFVNQYGDYLSYVGLSTDAALDDQQYSDSQTWGDYFRDQAVSMLTDTVTMYNTAMENGYEISDDVQSEIDDVSASIDSAAETYGTTRDAYLKQQYGAYMTDEIFMDNITKQYVANAYYTDYNTNHTYTDEEREAYYTENANNIDLASYEVYTVNADYTGIEGTTENSTDEVPTYTEAQDKQAMQNAETNANTILDRVNGGESLADLAAEYGDTYYSDKQDVSYSTFTDYAFDDWAFDSARQSGDTAVLEDADRTCWYVLVFNDRYRPDYNTIDVRHILIQPADSGLSEGDEGYEEAQELNMAQAKATAEKLLDEYMAGEHTEDAFAALATENSSDTGSSENGGLYTQVYQGQMVDTFNDWCFDANRKSGDTGIVETTYGYHVMYFVGEDIPYWEVRADSAMKADWYTDITEGANVKKNSLGIKAIG